MPWVPDSLNVSQILFDSSQAATTAIVQHPEHGELYARDPFCAGFCGPPLHALLDIAAENQASRTAAAAEQCRALPSALAQCKEQMAKCLVHC